MTVVRAKLKVESVKKTQYSNDDIVADISLRACYDDGDPSNKSWSKYTPTAQYNMTVTNPSAIDVFEEGDYFYLDFTKVE